MLKSNFILFLIGFSVSVSAQMEESPDQFVKRFFQAMYDGNDEGLASMMHDEASLQSIDGKKSGKLGRTVSKADFAASIGTAKIGDLDERISNVKVQRDGELATVWMDYAFYYKGKFSHCGTNAFTLVDSDGWQVVGIIDTRYKEPCKMVSEEAAINNLMDNWHLAASEADSSAYFSKMTDDAIYIGTDAAEVWSKRAFLSFAAPYFARGEAWDFKKVSRNIYSDDYKTLAWFDEVLDTWMGPCRGSGVVVKTTDGWKIKHYVLSVAVANDDIKEYLKILEE